MNNSIISQNTNDSYLLISDPLMKSNDGEFISVRNGHFIKAIVGCLACVPNLFLIILCLSEKTLRTRVNFMVCNLMFGNILMCTSLVAYSTIKYTDQSAPSGHFGCLSVIWFVLYAGYAPVWGIILAASSRALSYNGSSRCNQIMTTFRFFELRVAHGLFDVVMVSFMLEEVGYRQLATQCTYQYMIHDSHINFYYSLMLTFILLSAGTMCFMNRMYLRRKLIKSKVMLASPNTIHQRHFVPAPLCARPLLLITIVILAFLFALPRVALLMISWTKFWIVSSICPVVTAFILPFVFLFADQDMRFFMFSLFSLCSKNRSVRITENDDKKSELALTNKAFTVY